jgi:hypothetical protein
VHPVDITLQICRKGRLKTEQTENGAGYKLNLIEEETVHPQDCMMMAILCPKPQFALTSTIIQPVARGMVWTAGPLARLARGGPLLADQVAVSSCFGNPSGVSLLQFLAPGKASPPRRGQTWRESLVQKLLAAAALVATFASAAGRAMELPRPSSGASASLVGDPGGLTVARGGGMGGGGFRPAAGGMGGGTGGGMKNTGGGMDFMGPRMNSGVGTGPGDTRCAHHHAKSKNSPNPLNPLSWLSQCDSK